MRYVLHPILNETHRSPKTGLYSNLAKYDLPYPEAIFELDYFSEDPTAFYELAREIWPGTYHPTPTHFFIRHLHDMGVLKRNFTQVCLSVRSVSHFC